MFQVVHLTHVIETVVWRGHIRGGITSAYHMLNNRPVPKWKGGTGTRAAKRQNAGNWMEGQSASVASTRHLTRSAALRTKM